MWLLFSETSSAMVWVEAWQSSVWKFGFQLFWSQAEKQSSECLKPSVKHDGGTIVVSGYILVTGGGILS